MTVSIAFDDRQELLFVKLYKFPYGFTEAIQETLVFLTSRLRAGVGTS